MARMVDMWVAHPGEPERLAKLLRSEAERVQAELRVMTQATNEASCRICGSCDELTEEHTPSKTAGNLDRLLRGMIDYEKTVTGGEVAWTVQLIQGGASATTLCASCNNDTGRWYNPAYIRLVDAARPLAVPANAGTFCEISVELHPQRAAKQALTTLLATSQPGVTTRYPHLREMIMRGDTVRPLAPLTLWLYLPVNPGARISGVVALALEKDRKGHLLAEFSFWPLGWVLTFDDLEVDGAVNVSSWAEYGYHDKVSVALSVPCEWAVLPYPLDFRAPETIIAERAQRDG
jgi:hypothetical protein